MYTQNKVLSFKQPENALTVNCFDEQECIPVECVPTTAVAATGAKTPLPVNRMTHTSENITLPCGW